MIPWQHLQRGFRPPTGPRGWRLERCLGPPWTLCTTSCIVTRSPRDELPPERGGKLLERRGPEPGLHLKEGGMVALVVSSRMCWKGTRGQTMTSRAYRLWNHFILCTCCWEAKFFLGSLFTLCQLIGILKQGRGWREKAKQGKKPGKRV